LSVAATSRIRSAAFSLTGPLPLKTRDTVATDTPAFFATSLIVTIGTGNETIADSGEHGRRTVIVSSASDCFQAASSFLSRFRRNETAVIVYIRRGFCQ
jgi:hypothetical protein